MSKLLVIRIYPAGRDPEMSDVKKDVHHMFVTFHNLLIGLQLSSKQMDGILNTGLFSYETSGFVWHPICSGDRVMSFWWRIEP